MSQSGTYGNGGGGGGTPITTIIGDNGNTAQGPIVNFLTDIFTFPYLNGTVSFNGNNVDTITFRTWDDNENVGLGREVFKAGGPGGGIQFNTGLGWQAGISLDGGGGPPAQGNVLIGYQTGFSLTAAFNNVALGYQALQNATTGSFNIIMGDGAGQGYATSESSNILLNADGLNGESNTLRIGLATGPGNQELNQAFICGINGVTVTGTPVLVSSSDQLGIAVSSNRFKNSIQAMTTESDVIYKMRPVTFTWNQDSAPGLKDATQERQCGLIAEEVAEIFPQVVGFDKAGRPLNINYGDLTSLLINEIQKLKKEIELLKLR